MFRDFGNQGRGNPPYTGSDSGTNSLGNTGTSASQEQVGVLSFNQGKSLYGLLLTTLISLSHSFGYFLVINCVFNTLLYSLYKM